MAMGATGYNLTHMQVAPKGASPTYVDINYATTFEPSITQESPSRRHVVRRPRATSEPRALGRARSALLRLDRLAGPDVIGIGRDAGQVAARSLHPQDLDALSGQRVGLPDLG